MTAGQNQLQDESFRALLSTLILVTLPQPPHFFHSTNIYLFFFYEIDIKYQRLLRSVTFQLKVQHCAETDMISKWPFSSSFPSIHFSDIVVQMLLLFFSKFVLSSENKTHLTKQQLLLLFPASPGHHYSTSPVYKFDYSE